MAAPNEKGDNQNLKDSWLSAQNNLEQPSKQPTNQHCITVNKVTHNISIREVCLTT